MIKMYCICMIRQSTLVWIHPMHSLLVGQLAPPLFWKNQGAAPVVETAPPHKPSLGDLIHPGNCDRNKKVETWWRFKNSTLLPGNTQVQWCFKRFKNDGTQYNTQRSYQILLHFRNCHYEWEISRDIAFSFWTWPISTTVLFCVRLGAPHLAYSKRPKCRRPESPLPLPQRTCCNGVGRQATLKWANESNGM